MFQPRNLRLASRVKPVSIMRGFKSSFHSAKAHPVALKSSSRMLMGLATVLGFSALALGSLLSPILNNAAIRLNLAPIFESAPHSKTDGRFHLNYQELTIGSVTGMVLGIIIGKISSMLVFLGLSSYFLVQFLELRNIITVPWNSIISIGKERINVKDLVFNNVNFKIAFVLSFLIAAFNV